MEKNRTNEDVDYDWESSYLIECCSEGKLYNWINNWINNLKDAISNDDSTYTPCDNEGVGCNYFEVISVDRVLKIIDEMSPIKNNNQIKENE